MTDPDDDSCPSCGATSGVQQIASTSPRVQAWRCTACDTGWAVTVVELLGAARSVLRQVIAPAEQVDTLTDVELRERLLAMANRADRAAR
ncbi:MAG: hypothetical protein ACRDS1_16000 [Pseudonocardiaceae bacterium]